jgi:serine/threonine-protein kinase
VLRDGNDRLTAANTIIGTPHYMSPEHATGKPLDHRTDLFSLGVIVYELLAGALPFSGSGVDVALANVSRDPPPIAARAPFAAVDPLLEAFARKLMARRLGERFQSARDALAMLDLIERDRIAATRALCTLPARAVAPRAPALPRDSDTLPTITVERPRRRWPVLVAAALALAPLVALYQ